MSARAAFEAAIAGSFAWTQVDEPEAEAVPQALRWTWHLWSAGFEQIPPFLVHDLGFVLWRGPAVRFVSARRPDEERARRLRAEDRLLAPWLLDAGVRQAHVVLAGLPPELVDRAVAHAVGLAVGRRLDGLELPMGEVGLLRGVIERWSAPLGDDPRAELLRRAGDTVEDHGAQVDRIVDRLGGQALYGEEDLWEVSHLRDVPSEAARLALRTIHQTARWIGPPSPGTLAALRRQARDVPLDDTVADVYPTGGFDAMATRGVLENVVRSEVAYVGEGVLDDDSRIDMFDLRYLEGELLYYTRDESPLLEERRRLSVVVEVDELRHKVRELPTQTLVMCLACALRLHLDLVDALGPLGVFTSLALLGDDPQVVEEEVTLVRISLAAEIAHRRARVLGGEDLADPRRVVFSSRPRPSQAIARAWIRVGQRRFLVEESVVSRRKTIRSTTSTVDAADPAALRGLLDRLLLTT